MQAGQNTHPDNGDLERAVDEQARKYAIRKLSTLPVVDVLREIDPERSGKLSDCGMRVAFAYFTQHRRSTLTCANFCNMPRLCRFCAHARGIQLARAASAKAVEVIRERPGLLPWLVTFTVRNGPDLAERLNHLLDAFTVGWQRRANFVKGRRPWSEFCCPAGVIYSAEIKRGRNGGLWHPHLHCLMLVPEDRWYWHQGKTGYELEPNAHRRLCDEWQQVTGDSFVVNAKPLRSALGMANGEELRQENLMGELFEVFKYLTKPDETPALDVVEAWRVTQSKRLVRSYGNLLGVKIPENVAGDHLGGDAWEAWFRWAGGEYMREGDWKFCPERMPGDE